ncbi:MAG: glycerophosphoryl diester phosphodiesterase [Cycloclasticus sp.]|nr:glycerophosphoryl diester phosphodiesterase [Cycloclasticus sp.]MBQ0789536.1 glycerophosphoryl diester phosphodiesterase [Cycloclasticus sp.]
MLSIGHRGAMAHAPENTLLAIQKAIDFGVDAVEIDVHLVGGELLVIHDSTLERTTNGKGRLEDFTVEELRLLDAGQGEKIPLLNEVIHATLNKVGLNIELKGKGTGKTVVQQLSHLSEQQRKTLIISSFLMDELKQVYKLDPTIKLGVLVERNIADGFDWAAKLNAYSIHLSLQQLSINYLEQAHQKKLKIYVYTVNSIKDIIQMLHVGVDGIFSNYPDRVKQVLLGQSF